MEKTMEKAMEAKKAMEENNTLSIVSVETVKRALTCACCGRTVLCGEPVNRIRTRSYVVGISECMECAKEKRTYKKWERNLSKKNAPKNSQNIKPFTVFVRGLDSNDNGLLGFFKANGFEYATAFSANGERNAYIGRYDDSVAQSITPLLDSLFTSSHKVIVTCNNHIIKNTEDFRKVVEMGVNNAVVNKSVK